MTGTLFVEITVVAAPWRDAAAGIEAVAIRAAKAAWAVAGGSPDAELSVVLADDATVRDLNRAHRGKDAPTNVLAFPLSDDSSDVAVPPGAARLLGDVVLAFETVGREAERDRKPFEMHVSHLVVHGLLHLLGHDHHEDDEADRMETLEVRAMARLGYADPYAPVVEAAE